MHVYLLQQESLTSQNYGLPILEIFRPDQLVFITHHPEPNARRLHFVRTLHGEISVFPTEAESRCRHFGTVNKDTHIRYGLTVFIHHPPLIYLLGKHTDMHPQHKCQTDCQSDHIASVILPATMLSVPDW